jgi:hypothetical protein
MKENPSMFKSLNSKQTVFSSPPPSSLRGKMKKHMRKGYALILS